MKALLVDGFNLVRRIYAAVPADRRDPSQTQEHIQGTIRSSVASLQRALNDHAPSHCLVVFEQSGRNWRHQRFPDYKKDRSPMPSDLQAAIPEFEQAFHHVGVGSFSLAGYEADDVIATIAKKIADHRGLAVILSTDRNYCQLLSDYIQVYDHFGQRYLDDDLVHQRFQVHPRQLPDMLALAGDSSLSIPGIKSIGKRTAAKLINDYGSLEKVLNAADTIPGKLGSKLFSGREDAELARELFTLKTDIELGINLSQMRYVPQEPQKNKVRGSEEGQ